MIAHHCSEADLNALYARVCLRDYMSERGTRADFVAWRDFQRCVNEHLDAAEYWQGKLN